MRFKMLKCILLVLILNSNLCYCYKILISFPQPYKSHIILGHAFVRILLNAGHEVTYITYEPPKYESPKFRCIDVSSNVKNFLSEDTTFDFQRLIEYKNNFINVRDVFQKYLFVPNATIFHEDFQKLIHDTNEQFDLVITEWLYSELEFGLSSVFNCPLIVAPTMEPSAMFWSLLTGPNPAVTPNRLTVHDPPFSFLERVRELYNVVDLFFSTWDMSSLNNALFEEVFSSAVAKRGRPLPPYSKVRKNISLVLANSHVSTGRPMQLPQNFKQIGGFHIEENIPPLPENLQWIMDNAQYGVIYFSLGTVVKVEKMPNNIKMQLITMFSSLKQTVIWKTDSPMINSTGNVFMFDFVPQQSILAHPNCVLFITHGGLLSVTEAIHFGVPIVGVPFFADQYININRAVQRGFARKINAADNLAHNLKIAIEDMLTNSRYKEKMLEHSIVYHHRLVAPRDELVYWVEHVVKTRGAVHLQSPAKNVPLYQKLYLDLIMLIITSGVVLNLVVKILRKYTVKVNIKRTKFEHKKD